MAKRPEPKAFVVKNEKRGTTLHLGDGRKLTFGESAEVTPEIFKAIND